MIPEAAATGAARKMLEAGWGESARTIGFLPDRRGSGREGGKKAQCQYHFPLIPLSCDRLADVWLSVGTSMRVHA